LWSCVVREATRQQAVRHRIALDHADCASANQYKAGAAAQNSASVLRQVREQESGRALVGVGSHSLAQFCANPATRDERDCGGQA
jgi:hypothetical protein